LAYILIDGDGTRHGYQCEYNNNGYGMTCKTLDGSFIDYDITFAAPYDSTPIYATAKLPNGTVITYGASATYAVYPTRITDPNGNYITISYVNDQGPRLAAITDTVGRNVLFYYDSSNCLTAITAPDFTTGTTRTLVRLQYVDQALTHGYTSNPTPKVRAGSFKMLKAIYYPATATGYWLGDGVGASYSGYGMLIKVNEQRGMTFDNAPMASQGTITAGTMSHEMSYVYNSPTMTEPMYTEMREKWAGMDTAAPGMNATNGAVTQYAVIEETASSRRSTRITRPDGTVQRQWQWVHPGQYDDGLVYYDRTCAAGNACDYDTGNALRASSTAWVSGYYTVPRPSATFVTTRPFSGVANTAGNYLLTNYYYDGYAFNNRPTKIDEYGYSALMRTTTIDYELNVYYELRHIFGLPKKVQVKEGAIVKQKTEYVYDGSPYANAPNVVQHDIAFDPQDPAYNNMYDVRGMVTQIKSYPDPASTVGMVTESRTYDETGNLCTANTSCCEQMTYVYNLNTQYAYPEIQKRGHATDATQQVITYAAYNTNTGLVTSTTDANGLMTRSYYYESNGSTPGTLRLRREELPTGAMVEYVYNDTNLTVSTTAYGSITGGNNNGTGTGTVSSIGSQNLKTLDGIGRVCNEVAYGAAMVQDKVDTKYDGLGRVWKQTRPYRTSGTEQWYENFYDSLDRLLKVCTTIGGQTETLTEKFYDDDAPAPSVADANTKGNTIRTKDAWGRERWARFDWANRLYEVVEPDAAGAGTVAANGTSTRYTYDSLNNLTQTDQCVTGGVGEQVRQFKYDGLSRLTHQKLAERAATLIDTTMEQGKYVGVSGGGLWSDRFQYDTRSNLICHTDARGVKANFNYANDPLNRLQTVTYDKSVAAIPVDILPANAADLNVSYYYMTGGDRTRLMKVTDNSGMDEFTYDSFGRLNETKRTFPNRAAYPLQTNYLYDTLDRLSQMTYPAQWGVSGMPRKLEEMTFDAASRVDTLKYDAKTYASAFTYNAASQTTALTVGHTGAGYSQWNETYTYEPATGLLSGQKVQLAGAGTPALDLSYQYLKQGTAFGRTGQLTKIVNNKDNTKNKYYEYDALGRIKQLTSYTGTATDNPMANYQWTQTYGFDKFGNRTTVAKTGSVPNTDGLPSLAFTDANNKVKTNRITTAGYSYDEAGNLTRGQSDGGVWQKYQYDAAGRLACTKDDSDVKLAEYSYGASNHRLKQIEYTSGVGTTCYYAWDGNSITGEFNDTGTALAWMKSYVFLGGRLLATHTPGGTNFHHPDRLGTRLITSEMGGTVTAEQTNLPYGTALDGESMGMASNRRFTSYDRSSKTKLDYAVNRFYSSCQGRFTQVDPIGMNAVSLEDPQSLNLYAYVGGDPLNRIDPEGLFWGAIGRFFKKFGAAIAAAVAVLFGLESPSVNFRTPGFNGNAGVIGTGNGTGNSSSPNIFRTPGINGNGVGGVGSYANDIIQRRGGGNRGPGTPPRARHTVWARILRDIFNPPRQQRRTVPNVGRTIFGELRFRGLVQNRPLRELTDQEIRDAFEGSPYTLSNHAISRLKDPRTEAVGIRTLNDVANVINNGDIAAGQGTAVTLTRGRFEAVIDARTRNIITFKPD
jgi:RHS repeat-associated protein